MRFLLLPSGKLFKKLFKTGEEEDDLCEHIPEHKCHKVPVQICNDIEECHPVNVKRCKAVPVKSCWTVPLKQCKKVSREECIQVPKEICKQVRDQFLPTAVLSRVSQPDPPYLYLEPELLLRPGSGSCST